MRSTIDKASTEVEAPDSPSGAGKHTALARRLDWAEFDRIRENSTKLTSSGFRTLRWLAIILPVLFIVGLNYLLHTALHRFHDFPGILVVLALLVLLTGAFSFAIFGLVERLERRVLERNAMLAALVAIGREAGASLDLGELLDNSLAAILEITSAEAAEVWLADDDGLLLAHHRGVAPEAFGVRQRLQFGEGLPGLVAEKGSPIIVHDLLSDTRFVRPEVQELGFESFCALPLAHRGETYGVLCVAARDREAMRDEAERGLLEGVAERLAAAIENSRLHERVLDAAVLEERERIARELHDGLAQVLGYINTQTLAVRKLLASDRTEEARVQLEAMEKAAKRVYGDVREGIFSLRTPLGRGDRLTDAVRAHLDNYREMPGVPTTLEVVEDGELPPLPPASEIQLMWIIQEALNNVRNHAGAGSATVRFSTEDNELIVSVEDNGRGFKPEQRARTGWPHFGLQTMRERAEAIGGRFEIDSEVDHGTSVRVRVPLSNTSSIR
ncbi:MAG: GAF domain-containing sensor histidine kinase [Solirubrobacterales bacterium]